MKSPHSLHARSATLLTLLSLSTTLPACRQELAPKGGGEGSDGADGADGGDGGDGTDGTDGADDPLGTGVDLVSPPAENEARAGIISDPAALFAGSAASGRVGDFLLLNSHARFLIQAIRPGDYYIGYGGVLLDADATRNPGEAGRDMLDELSPMIGMGRVVRAESVEVLSVGGPETPAVIEVRGKGAPMQLITGAFEDPSFVPDIELEVLTTYTLRPGSPLLEVETTTVWPGPDTVAQWGDVALYGKEVANAFGQVAGFNADLRRNGAFAAVIATEADSAFAIFGEGAEDLPFSPLETILGAAAPVTTGLTAGGTLTAGTTVSWRRYWGAGRDLAHLTDAWYAQRGVATQTVSGTVSAAGSPVPGARVVITDAEGGPLTLAWTDPAGQFSAQVPADISASVLVDARGDGRSVDLPAGAPWYPPHGAPEVQAEVLASIETGIPSALGLGTAGPLPAGTDLTIELTPPGTLQVDTGDGLPAVVRVDFTSADPGLSDVRSLRSRPDGRAGWLYLRDGSGSLPVEPGTYSVTVHRGLRWEAYSETVTLTAGETTPLSAPLQRAFETPGVLAIDPHSHASPSPDGKVEMAERLVSAAAHGIELQLVTDHDHVADYRPLYSALGLEMMGAVEPASEVSPVMRGHHNVWPLTPDPEAAGGGALRWWESNVDTSVFYANIRATHGEIPVLQVNHPSEGSGMFGFADLSADGAEIGKPDFWSSDFEAVEVLNSGDWVEFSRDYLNLTSHGIRATPVGVSDSHGHESGIGANLTWLYAGVDHAADLSPEILTRQARAGATVAAQGLYVAATIDGIWAPGTDQPTGKTLNVSVFSASWSKPDRVELLKNGTVVDTVSILPEDAGDEGLRWSGSFELDSTADAHYVVQVQGAADMSPVYPGRRPYAFTAPIYLDADGDGWEAPLGDLIVTD